MLRTRITAWTTAVYFGFSMLLFIGKDAHAQCAPPIYFTIRSFVNQQERAGSVYIWIPALEFTFDKVLCLSQTLNARYPQWNDIVVLFFSSEAAAARFDVSPMTIFVEAARPDGGAVTEQIDDFRRELRAIYAMDHAKNENYLTMTPLGLNAWGSYDTEPFETKIDLPISGTPRCHTELGKRCVLALEPIRFPDQLLEARASGTVTLTGQIRREGTVADVQVAEAVASSSLARDLLISNAVENLKTWWAEPSRNEDAFRITYTYAIDSLMPRGKLEVRFGSPQVITIRASAP